MAKILDIEKLKRNEDYQLIHKEIERTELGLRAVCIMYDEHSNDVNSNKNIFNQKNNIYYKLASIKFQYKIFLEQVYRSEKYVKELDKQRKLRGFVMGNPYFEKVELELSTVFDNIVFNSVSIFDYISHITCYVVKRNKQKTDYWSGLKKSARGKNNEISASQISEVIKYVDDNLVNKLDDYRSRLIHRKRDEHKFYASIVSNNKDDDYQVCLIASEILLSKKYLSIIKEEMTNHKYISLTYVTSFLIKTTIKQIEILLEGLVFHIKDNSQYTLNLNKQMQGKGFMTGFANPITRRLIKLSDNLWNNYKGDNMEWIYQKNN